MNGMMRRGVTAIATLASLKAVPPKYPTPSAVQLIRTQTRMKNKTFPAFSEFNPTIQYTMRELRAGNIIVGRRSTKNLPMK